MNKKTKNMIPKIDIKGKFKAPDYIFWMIANLYNGILENFETLQDMIPANIEFSSDVFTYDYNCVLVALRALDEIGYESTLPTYRKCEDADGVRYIYGFNVMKMI